MKNNSINAVFKAQENMRKIMAGISPHLEAMQRVANIANSPGYRATIGRVESPAYRAIFNNIPMISAAAQLAEATMPLRQVYGNINFDRLAGFQNSFFQTPAFSQLQASISAMQNLLPKMAFDIPAFRTGLLELPFDNGMLDIDDYSDEDREALQNEIEPFNTDLHELITDVDKPNLQQKIIDFFKKWVQKNPLIAAIIITVIIPIFVSYCSDQLPDLDFSEPPAITESIVTSETTKLPQTIFDSVSDNIKKLESLFPAAVKDGQLDIDALREELGQFEDVGKEKYELTWAGKQNAKKLAQEDVLGRTLKFVPQDSKNAETTENLYIEGDNLEVLKLLRQNYYGAIKMIYIDPPYNTGNDFVYRDDFAMGADESAEAEGEIEDGERLVVNQKSSNRYHANWLNMMYPRLKVAKDLLREDGVIFISIDDNESDSMKKICNEIFGEKNFVACIVWKKKTNGNNMGIIPPVHDFIIVYAKNAELLTDIGYDVSENYFTKKYSNPDNDYRGPWDTMDLSANHKGPYFKIINPLSKEEFWPPEGRYWVFNEEEVNKRIADGRIIFGKSGNARPVQKVFANDREESKIKAETWWDNHGMNEDATDEARKLFSNPKIFSHPKPTKLLKHIVEISSGKDDTVMDFFSGSGTFAQAVFEVNADQKDAKRKFLLVQLSEDLEESIKKSDNNGKASLQAAIDFLHSENKPLFLTELGKERIRRAGEKVLNEWHQKVLADIAKDELKDEMQKESFGGFITQHTITRNPDTGKEEHKHKIFGDSNDSEHYIKKNGLNPPDIGFKVFKTADTNIRWTSMAVNLGQLDIDENLLTEKDRLDFMPGYTDFDVVYEIMLRQRDIPLSVKVEKLSQIGDRTYIFADSYIVCLEETITQDTVEALAKIEPTPIKYIFRDSAFEDNITLKDETMRRLAAYIARNTGNESKTYTVEFI